MQLKQLHLNQIGQDSEFFLWDEKKGEVVPSYLYFPTREESVPNPSPTRADLKHKYHKWLFHSNMPTRVFRDGLAVEVNTAPSTCRAFLWDDTRIALAVAEPWKRKPRGLRYTTAPTVYVSEEMRKAFPPDLQVLGCSASVCAYKERVKEIVVNPKTLPFRTCGHHFHASFYSPLPHDHYPPVIKLADLFLGLPETYIFGDSLAYKRRTLYGQAGEFRVQNYYNPKPITGIEYRALSSRIWNHPGIFSLFAGLWKFLVCMNYACLWEYWDKAWEDDLQEAINKGGEALQEKLLVQAAKLMDKAQSKYDYYLNFPHHGDSNEVPHIWKKLKEMNKEGAFPDAGVINKSFPEGHKGWTEWSTKWGI